MNRCYRCHGVINTDSSRDVDKDGKVFHLYCKWKLEQEAIRNISAEKGEGHADTLHQGSRGGSSVCDERDANTG